MTSPPPRVKYKTIVEHELVHSNDAASYLAAGWEPMPNVEHVVSYALAQPSTYVFLRRYKRVER